MALELAAVLGREVEVSQWQRACGARGVRSPELSLVGALLEQRLARGGEHGAHRSFELVHGMLRESLLRRAREAGRLVDHHLACAELLEEASSAADLERRGRHLLAAAEPEQALGPLLDAARTYRLSGHFQRAEQLLEQRADALQDLGLPEADERWGAGWVQRARICGQRGEHAEAERWLERAAQAADQHGWEQVAVRVMLLRARLFVKNDTLGRADAYLRAAQRRCMALQEPRLLAECRLLRAEVELRRQQSSAEQSNPEDVAKVEDLYRAVMHTEQVPASSNQSMYAKYHAAWAHVYLLACAAAQLRWNAWATHLARALALIEETSCADVDVAQMAQLAGDIAERLEAPLYARQAYLISLQQWQALGQPGQAEKIQGLLAGLP